MGYEPDEDESKEMVFYTLISGISIPIGLLIYRPLALIGIIIGGYPIFKRSYLSLKSNTIDADVFMTLGIIASASIFSRWNSCKWRGICKPISHFWRVYSC